MPSIHSLFFVICLLLVVDASATTKTNTAEIKTENKLENSSVTPLAPGYGKLGYELPQVGSYHLPPVTHAPNGQVLDEQGNQRTLHELYADKYTLLSFIYSHCGDVNGCPLTAFVFNDLKKRMKKDPVLANRLQLISMSFDPERDTPEAMKQYGDNFKYAGKKGTWRFLTTQSIKQLEPILKDYNQDIQREKSVNGEDVSKISHILRVFLIDPKKQIRNIYSVGFLHADLLVNDLKTLLMTEEKDQQQGGTITNNSAFAITFNNATTLSKPGDVKDGYDKKSYTTQSKALTERNGKAVDLLVIAMHPPLGLPKVPVPTSNPLTKEKITLGRKLFFDRRLSLNDTVSCAMCHIPEQGFTSNEISMAVGLEGRSVRRNSPTIYNVSYATKLFHDGRDNTLEEQIWGPLLARNEMANPSIGYVLNKLRRMPDYKGLFEAAFAKQKQAQSINMRSVGEALASYQRTLISADSLFDRWFYAKQKEALTKNAQRGFELFSRKAKCISCHSINNEYALFSDYKLHNTGIGYRESMGIRPEKERMVLAPGVFIEVDSDIVDSVGEPAPADLGLYEITQNPHDRWKYKTPSLRNISLTAPYMHNGSLRTLEAVVQFYNKGGVKNELLDLAIKPLNLNEQEVNDLVAFLKSLTGSNVNVLVADAFAAPIGDLTHNDPNWTHNTQKMKEK